MMPRKKLPEGEGKRIPLGMRTTREMRAKLEAAAVQTGRSLAAEVEYRLERSFDREALLAEVREAVRLPSFQMANPLDPQAYGQGLGGLGQMVPWHRDTM